MKSNFCERWSKNYARESVYNEQEIRWCMGILYRHFKSQKTVHEKIVHILVICANGNVPSLYQLKNTFIEGGIIKKKDIKYYE